MQSVFASKGAKACGLWQPSHATPPACAPVSTWAMLEWQLVHVAAMRRESSPCGTWQSTHAPFFPCKTWMVEWQAMHEEAAAPGSCGVWQLMQSV